MKPSLKVVAAVAALLLANAALACGQVACDDVPQPGATVAIRGYGYGFEGGDRAVTLKWVSTRQVVGSTRIDGNGDFTINVVAPDSPGLHRLLVSVGDNDPTPVEVTVPVVLPWYRQAAVSLSSVAAPLGVALAALFIAGTGALRLRLRRRQRHGEPAQG